MAAGLEDLEVCVELDEWPHVGANGPQNKVLTYLRIKFHLKWFDQVLVYTGQWCDVFTLLFSSPAVIDFICNEAVNNSYLNQEKSPMAQNGSLAEAPGSPGQGH